MRRWWKWTALAVGAGALAAAAAVVASARPADAAGKLVLRIGFPAALSGPYAAYDVPELNGMNFAALAWGPEHGPLALCLHGYPDTAHTWRHLGPYLGERGWRVVAPFMRGYGPTDLAPDGAYQLGAQCRTHLVGGHDRDLVGFEPRVVLLGAARQQLPEPDLRGLGAAIDDGAQVGRQPVIERLAERCEGERQYRPAPRS